jgi:hypothetical protein
MKKPSEEEPVIPEKWPGIKGCPGGFVMEKGGGSHY